MFVICLFYPVSDSNTMSRSDMYPFLIMICLIVDLMTTAVMGYAMHTNKGEKVALCAC